MDYPLTQTGAEVQELLDSIGPLAGRVTELEASASTLNGAIESEAEEREAADAAQDAVIEILQKGLGSSDTVDELTVSLATGGKAVDWNTQQLKDKTGYGVSDTLRLQKGKIYLFPVASAGADDVAFLSQVVTRNYAKAIVYTYVYKTVSGRKVIDTATADYDSTLVYTYGYDAEGNLLTIIDKNGDQVPGLVLPGTREVTETAYSVLVNKPTVSSGKFIYVPTRDMNAVVSYVASELAGVVEVLDFSLVASLTSTLMGTIQEHVLCEVVGSMNARIDGIEDFIKNMGDIDVAHINCAAAPTVCGQPWLFVETDEPAGPAGFIGQLWYDRINTHLYIATSTSGSVSTQWKLIV